ncbi:nucleoside monophosphate kinase [Streptomyces sp. SR-10]|uniref:nucleoside monophosphate kinase n=1 Tax=Streptomyces sp. SR-10 TaxID=3416442 RepID=UPI003CEAD0DB
MRILLIGLPGAGKGTQAVRIASHLPIPHISTGDLFCEHIDQGTELGQNAYTHICAGLLVPTGVVKGRLARPDIERGFLRLNLRTQEELFGFLRDLGGTPSEVLDEPELLDYLTGLLRTDLTILKSYPDDSRNALDVPLCAYYGEGDLMPGHELMSPWDSYSSASVSIRFWPGGPLYLYDRPAEFAAQRVSDVRVSPRLLGSRPTVRQEASWG